MKSRLRLALGAALLVSCLGASAAALRSAAIEARVFAAGSSQDPARPAPVDSASLPYERMAFFEGTWELQPGGIPASIAKQAGRLETCGWLPGGRHHMICRTYRTAAGGGATRESMSILSYREEDSTYIQYFAFPGGANLMYHGRLDGDRWVMEMQPSPLLQKNLRFRMIITPVEGGIRFVEERSKEGGPWAVTEDFRYRRVKQD
jgi:hypothetical protein